MLEVLSAPDHVAAFRIYGTLTETDYNAIIPVIEEKLLQHPSIGVLADVSDLGELTIEAIRRDVGYSLSKFGQWHRFQRAAVITDKRWLAGATKLTDAMFPQVEARVFAPGETDAAMRWAASPRGEEHRSRRGLMLGLALAVTGLLTLWALKAARQRA